MLEIWSLKIQTTGQQALEDKMHLASKKLDTEKK